MIRLPRLRHSGALVVHERVQAAREREQQGHGVVGDFRALHDLVVGQDDVRFLQVVAAVEEEGMLDTGGDGLHPAELLGRAHFVGLDVADEAVGVGDLAHDGVFRDGYDRRFGRHGLQFCDARGIGIQDEDFLGLSGQRGRAECERGERAQGLVCESHQDSYRIKSAGVCKLPQRQLVSAKRKARTRLWV